MDLSGQGDGLPAVSGGPSDCDVWLGVEEGMKSCASESVAVCD